MISQKNRKKFKKKMLKFRLMEFHKELIKKGKYMEAKKVLVLLIKEKLPLGLNDSDYYLEECFQKIGCRISYSNLTGQWSLDIMQNGDDFWLIDMATADCSALNDCIPKEKLNKVPENWIPDFERLKSN